ncbi:DUF3021 domain-containing protein [Alkalihalobacillus sp. AL-G]|uniref:DUF3021 domain-containing protein n=1 Tax=Alkalihalobacillus sp. AL-G TaxID=2926399 RepID=UPI00272BF3F4|nr:DUF3021 domain-containing protein [Alkalihalobacillus sp. AL-G]WLD92549.1 DUF3021 domain-containing protein [Alkalihalobacillus sp. AL-G]
MVFEVLRRAIIGIGFGGLITFCMLTVLKIQQITVSLDEVWANMLGSLVVGIYFGIGSLIFDQEDWSPLRQIVIHLTLSLIVFFPIALLTGWVPAEPLPIIICLITFLIIYAIFWFSIRWYFKRMEESMNKSIH